MCRWGRRKESSWRNQLFSRDLGGGCLRATTFPRTLAICCDHVVIIVVSKLDRVVDAIRAGDGLLVDLTERGRLLIPAVYVVAYYVWRRTGFPGKIDTVRWLGSSLGQRFRATRRLLGGLAGLRCFRFCLQAGRFAGAVGCGFELAKRDAGREANSSTNQDNRSQRVSQRLQ